MLTQKNTHHAAKKKKDVLKGVLFLTGPVSDTMVKNLSQEVIAHNLRGKLPFMQILINSPGGNLLPALGFCDVMSHSRLPIYTTGYGLVASAALLFLMCGAPGYRQVLPNTMLLSHRFSGMAIGDHADLVAQRKLHDTLHDRVVSLYQQQTRLKKRSDVLKYLLRESDVWLTPEEAVEFGLIDGVARPGEISSPANATPASFTG